MVWQLIAIILIAGLVKVKYLIELDTIKMQ